MKYGYGEIECNCESFSINIILEHEEGELGTVRLNINF